MENIIIYGSRYGSTRRYAENLSEKTGIPAVSYTHAPNLALLNTVIYLGGLYAGGVVGLAKTMRHFSLREEQNLFIVTVGLADPTDAKNQDNIRSSLQKQLSKEQYQRAKIFHLRGGIDYAQLKLYHRLAMWMLYQSIRHLPAEKQTEENMGMIETYGKKVDFVDFDTLFPLVEEIKALHPGKMG